MPSKDDSKDKQYMQARKHTGEAQSNVADQEEANVGLALMIVDVINDIDFPDNDHMVKSAKPMAERIKVLKDKCQKLGVPVIYCNDNFGKWKSDIGKIYDHVTNDDTPGKPIAQLLKPGKDDYFMLKPKHSAFYGSALDHLLTYLQVKSLIIVGMAGNVCILFTANDAYMRDYATFVPRDCISSSSPEEHDAALLLMEKVLRTNTSPSTELDLEKIVKVHTEQNGNAKKRKQQEEDSSEQHGEDMGADKQKSARTGRTGKGGCRDPKGNCD
ncbi:hypothetical protein HK097_007792 [Rhizophlyctis rosea]|uniref:Isochorismatase-like domain-containing protein n=1 Tax=Rhizophlyctis rosea TaxID=64517 RepID=A0AAD5X7Z9_9FUNG|nr:hypothetical protein HK097_007792 [Rhizophlyctis rosea]